MFLPHAVQLRLLVRGTAVSGLFPDARCFCFCALFCAFLRFHAAAVFWFPGVSGRRAVPYLFWFAVIFAGLRTSDMILNNRHHCLFFISIFIYDVK